MDINKRIKIFNKPLFSLKHVFIFITVVFIIITLVNAFNIVMSFVKVGDVEISGIYSPYEKLEILKTTEIRGSDFWCDIDTDEIEEKLLTEMKYLESASVSKQFPNKIIIKLQSKSPRWYIDVQSTGKKMALDGGLYVIDEIKNTDGVTKLVLPDVKEVMADEVPLFGDSEITRKRTLEIIDTVRTSSLRPRITELDVSDRTNIKIVIDGKYYADLGDKEELARKLADINDLLETRENIKNSNGGYFTAYTGSPVSFKAYDN